jgi:hypothetical protein
MYAIGSTLTFGFFARRVQPDRFGDKDYFFAAPAAMFWPITLLFIIPAVLYLERIERHLAEERRRAKEEADMIKMVDEELAREDRLLAAVPKLRLEAVPDPGAQREAHLDELVSKARRGR